jgi:hypothetical protein
MKLAAKRVKVQGKVTKEARLPNAVEDFGVIFSSSVYTGERPKGGLRRQPTRTT